jgi:hypothetical protein
MRPQGVLGHRQSGADGIPAIGKALMFSVQRKPNQLLLALPAAEFDTAARD